MQNVKQILISSKTDIGLSDRPLALRILPRDGHLVCCSALNTRTMEQKPDTIGCRMEGQQRELAKNVKSLLPYNLHRHGHHGPYFFRFFPESRFSLNT